MVDQFQAFLLAIVTALFVLIAIRMVRSERDKTRRPRRQRTEPNRLARRS